MAARKRSRYRGSLGYKGIYRPRTAATVARELQPKAPRKSKRPKAAPKPARGLPPPRSSAGRRLVARGDAARILGPRANWSGEARHLYDAANAETRGSSSHAGSRALWGEYLEEQLARRYRSQRSSAPRKGSATSSEWVRVKAYKRRRPHRKR